MTEDELKIEYDKLKELQKQLTDTKNLYDKKIEQLEKMNQKFKSGLRVLNGLKEMYAESLVEAREHSKTADE